MKYEICLTCFSRCILVTHYPFGCRAPVLQTTVRIMAIVRAVLLTKAIAACVLLDTKVATVVKVNSTLSI